MHRRRRGSARAAFVWLAFAGILAGCDGGASCPDDERDSSDAAADVPDTAVEDAADGAGPCPAPIAESCPADAGYPPYFPFPPHELPVLLRAADVGPGTRFLAASQVATLLAEREDAAGRTVLVLTEAMDAAEMSEVRATLSLPPDSPLRAVDAVRREQGSAETSLPELVVLLCDVSRCSLYGADLPEAGAVELAALAGGEVPAAGGMNGLWWHEGSAACAYGRGVHCFDGTTWTSPVLATAYGRPFNEMRTCSPLTLAVGDEGRSMVSRWPEWGDQGSASTWPDWLAVTCDGDGFFLWGGSGGVVRGSDTWAFCPIAGEDIAFLDAEHDWRDPLLLGVTASGRVFLGAGRYGPDIELCYTGQTVGPLVDAAKGSCGLSENYLLLTADTLYGTLMCAIE